MTWLRRIGTLAVVLGVVWLAALLILGFALEGRTRRGIAERVGESLQADAAIDRGSLSLIRGGLALGDLTARRADLIGQLSLAVSDLRCELPALGGALFDRDCRDLIVRGVRLEVSTLALFRLHHPKRPPLHARHVVIDDAHVALAATALLPSLGRVTVDIEHAEAGDTVFKTPLSFVFALRELRATIALPAGLTLHVGYAAGQLELAGSMFGSTPITLPIALPVAELTDDAGGELAKLVAFGKQLAERLVTERAEAWLKSKLSP